MTSVSIAEGVAQLMLTFPRSRVRLCDNQGNHIPRPVSDGINSQDYFIEWMITNEEIINLVKQIFNKSEIEALIVDLQTIKISLRDSEYSSRAAQKEIIHKKLGDFDIYEYTELFYSFEKNIEEGIKVRITFKMGDYTLAAHMFVLITLGNKKLNLSNNEGQIKEGDVIGSGGNCLWRPSKEEIREITIALANSSEDHKNDLIFLLQRAITS